MRAVICAAVLTLAGAVGAQPAQPPPAAEALLQQLSRAVKFKQVALSPDGARVAWVEAVATPEGPHPMRTVVQMKELRAGAPAPVRITAATAGGYAAERALAWSPDGTRLAFLSDAASPEQSQLFVWELASGRARALTKLTGALADPRWSPDGKQVALLLIEGTLEEKGPTGPASRQTGVVEEHPAAQRLVLVDAAGVAPLRILTPEGLSVYEYSWSPQGTQLVVSAAPPPGDANWWTAQLYLVSAAGGGAEPRALYKPKLQVAEPRFSPDGASVAFIEGLMSDQGVTGGDVMLVPASGGPARNLTPGMKLSATTLHWPSAERLVLGAHAQGETAVAQLDPRSGKLEVLWHGAERVSAGDDLGLSLATDGQHSAVMRESFERAAEVYAGPIGQWTAVTQRNAGVKGSVGAVQSVRWKSDRYDVQGWLVAPSQSVPGARAPMVTVVHGGPAGATVPSFRQDVLLLASQGYYVFLPNPRGSYGQGEAFTRANVRDFGRGDLRDILRGVDAVLASAPVDGARLGITGWSYGGYMTMWAVTQTNRFKAAMAGAGISNWQSYYGTNRIDTWMLPFFGASVYDEPAVYARSSPMTFIKRVSTPTLVIHGERDAEVPASQGFEFWKALKTLGVDTQLVVYPDEGHGLRRPAHQKDRYLRTVEWFDRHLAPQPAEVKVPASR